MNTNLKKDHSFTVINLWLEEELLLEMVWFVLCGSEELLWVPIPAAIAGATASVLFALVSVVFVSSIS